MKNNSIIACLGKGGVGKTIISSMLAKIAISQKKKTLLIDADPVMGLATALNLDGFKTIGASREEIIRTSKTGGADSVCDMADYVIMESLFETSGYSMIVMGRTDTIGCYCPVNNLLRDGIKKIADSFDVVIIDAEAGIEQLNRQVVDIVHYPILITDNSLRGARTAVTANEMIKKSLTTYPVKTGVIFNRVGSPAIGLVDILEREGIIFFGSIPPDPVITERDTEGLPSLDMPEDSISYKALLEIVKKIDL